MNPGVVRSVVDDATTILVNRLHSRINMCALLVSRIRRSVFYVC